MALRLLAGQGLPIVLATVPSLSQAPSQHPLRATVLSSRVLHPFFQLQFGAEVVGEGGPGVHGTSLSCLLWKCPMQTSFTVCLGLPAGARCHGKPEMVLLSWAGEGWAHGQWRGLIYCTHQAVWDG